jgi:DNA mismatch repair protein MutS2
MGNLKTKTTFQENPGVSVHIDNPYMRRYGWSTHNPVQSLSNPLYQTLEFDKVLEDLASRACCPVTGQRLRELTPLPSPDLVRRRLTEISEIRHSMDGGRPLPLETFEDINPHLKALALEGSRLDPEAFRRIHTILDLTGRIHRFFRKHQSEFPILFEAAARLAPNPGLVKEIARVIDLSSLEIPDHASKNLASLRRKLVHTRERVERQMEDLLDRLGRKGVLQERIITIRSGRLVLPVKETHKHAVKGILHDKSASGATVFLEPIATLELNNQIRRLEVEEQHEIERILYALTALVRKDLPDLERNFESLMTLDSVHAMALASKATDQHEPAVNTEGIVDIKRGRHPLLLLKKPLHVVPLSLSLGETCNTLVVTGPNAGGKTVALKTVGLLALMASCGLHVPADGDSRIALFNRIFASVGDAQSIEMDLSTFSARLGEIKTIIEEAAPGDLVLIDEIGTGTDPQEGSALAMAVLETLTARKVVTLVTTHHGALKAFAHATPGIANGSMAFDAKSLTPTYTYRADIPGSSYALEIAKRMGLPEAVVRRSRAFVGSEANRLEGLVLELEEQLEENKRLSSRLKGERRRVDSLKERLESEEADLAGRAKRLRQEAAQEAKALIQEANATVEEAIRSIRESRAAKEGIREARALMAEEREHLNEVLKETQPDREPPGRERGDFVLQPEREVYWQRTGMTGTMMSGEDAHGTVLVAFGKLKARVSKEELEPVQKGSPTEAAEEAFRVEMPAPRGIRPEADMRGMRVEEALSVIDKYLDDALLAGLREVRIIHGIGTGALRKNLIPFLNAHPLVHATRAGGAHEDNPGVTVVEMATK